MERNERISKENREWKREVESISKTGDAWELGKRRKQKARRCELRKVGKGGRIMTREGRKEGSNERWCGRAAKARPVHCN